MENDGQDLIFETEGKETYRIEADKFPLGRNEIPSVKLEVKRSDN